MIIRLLSSAAATLVINHNLASDELDDLYPGPAQDGTLHVSLVPSPKSVLRPRPRGFGAGNETRVRQQDFQLRMRALSLEDDRILVSEPIPWRA